MAVAAAAPTHGAAIQNPAADVLPPSFARHIVEIVAIDSMRVSSSGAAACFSGQATARVVGRREVGRTVDVDDLPADADMGALQE